MNSGRKKDPVWNKFSREKVRAGWKAKCNKCGITQQGLVERLKAHIRICDGESEHEEREIIEVEQAASTSASTSEPPAADNSSSSVVSRPKPPAAKKRQRSERTIDGYMVRTSAAQRDELDKLVAEFFYATNTAFNHAEHPTFKKLITKLHPGKSNSQCYIKFFSIM